MSSDAPIHGFVMTGDVPGGRAGATIEVTPAGVVAQTREHGRFALRHGESNFERGGASGNMIFVRSTISDLIVGSEDPRFLALLRATADSSTLSRIDEALAADRDRRRASTRAGWKLFLAAVGLLVAGYYGVIVAARSAITTLPRSIDVQLGDTAFESMRATLSIAAVPEVDAALAAIVARLSPHADLDGFAIRAVYVDSDVVNAMSLPGGRVFVYRGLIRILEDPDELAAVIAHEIAHVTERHGLERIGGQLGSFVLLRALLGDAGAVLESLGGAAGELIRLDWSREDEHEADRVAVEMCAKAGIDPLALERAFAAMEKASEGAPEIPKWFGTHPPTAERRDAVRGLASKHVVTDPRPLEVDWAAVLAALAN
jgi:Zn-dependent protease with chaperone function